MSRSTTGQFLSTMGTLLSEQCSLDVLRSLRYDWPPSQLIPFLTSENPSLVHMAAMCLGLTGSMEHSRYLAPLLGHDDDEIAQSAENSLWQIWMRGDTPAMQKQLKEAICCIDAEDYDVAVAMLAEITRDYPSYAEVYHQQGILANICEAPQAAIVSYRHAMRLNPYHFAAAMGIGQSHLELDDPRQALAYYQLAFRINPRLDGPSEMITGLSQLLGISSDC